MTTNDCNTSTSPECCDRSDDPGGSTFEDIGKMFRGVDVAHMSKYGVFLSQKTYMSDPTNVLKVYGHLCNGAMPGKTQCDADGKQALWTQTMLDYLHAYYLSLPGANRSLPKCPAPTS